MAAFYLKFVVSAQWIETFEKGYFGRFRSPSHFRRRKLAHGTRHQSMRLPTEKFSIFFLLTTSSSSPFYSLQD